jgi:DNA-binding NarL/FixJ family response regulator
MIKILIADDHEVVRRGLKQIVAETMDMVVAGEACRGQEVLDEVSKSDYDVVLLDISMPDRSGLDILKELKRTNPGLPVMMLSMYPEELYAVRALRAGARGYLTKESAPDELIGAISRIALGGRYISSSLGEKLASELGYDADKPPHLTLSDREYQVMVMIASGKSVKQISEELMLGVKTISTYRSRILEKMGMKNNAELIRYAIESRLVN